MSSTARAEEKVEAAVNHNIDDSPPRLPLNSMSVSITIYWLLPMLCIAIMSRFAVDTGPAFPLQPSRPISIKMSPQGGSGTTTTTVTSSRTSTVSPTPQRDTAQRATKDKGDTSTPLILANKPYSYQEVKKHPPIHKCKLFSFSTSFSSFSCFCGHMNHHGCLTFCFFCVLDIHIVGSQGDWSTSTGLGDDVDRTDGASVTKGEDSRTFFDGWGHEEGTILRRSTPSGGQEPGFPSPIPVTTRTGLGSRPTPTV